MKLLICTQKINKNDPILGFFVGWVLEFSKYFERIDVICLEKGEYDLPEHVYVHTLGKERGSSKLSQLVLFYAYFARVFFRRPQYVFFHMGAIYNVLAAPFYFLRFFTRTKFYWWKAHGHINWFGRVALLFVDKVITSTYSGFPINTKKRKVVGQAIDNDLFSLPENKVNRPLQVVFVGRISPVKNIDIFIKVAKKLEKHNYTFSVIGPAYDIEYLDSLKKEAIGTNIKFLGPKTQTELVDIYQKAYIFLNTSMTHSMDKTVLEAALCGCIPITANKAFKDMLHVHNLYLEEQEVDLYVEHILALEDSDLESLRVELHKMVVDHHSLTSFPERIFNIE